MLYNITRCAESMLQPAEKIVFQSFNKEEITKVFHSMIGRGEEGDTIEYSSQDETGWYPNMFEVEIIDKKPMVKTNKHGNKKKYIPYTFDGRKIIENKFGNLK